MTTTSRQQPGTEEAADRSAGAAEAASSGRLVSDTLAVTGRNVRRVLRTPQLLVFSTVQPVIFLLVFVYVFGGAIGAGGSTGVDYEDFVIPGILVQSTVFGSIQTAIGLATDLSSGFIDRLRSLPMARAAVLAGRTFADSARNLFVILLTLGVGYLVGFDFQAGVVPAVGAVALVLLFGFSFSWIYALVGLLTRDAETAQAASFPLLFPLVFASSVFVPVATLPSWLQGFATYQPVSVTAEAVRALAIGGETAGPVLGALAWMVGLLLVFVPLCVRQYRRG